MKRPTTCWYFTTAHPGQKRRVQGRRVRRIHISSSEDVQDRCVSTVMEEHVTQWLPSSVDNRTLQSSQVWYYTENTFNSALPFGFSLDLLTVRKILRAVSSDCVFTAHRACSRSAGRNYLLKQKIKPCQRKDVKTSLLLQHTRRRSLALYTSWTAAAGTTMSCDRSSPDRHPPLLYEKIL